MNSQKLLQVLYKKAVGFKTKEISSEYAANDGEMLLTKKKIVSKDIPPDLNALKFLMETDCENTNCSSMSDEQLKKEALKYFSAIERDNDNQSSDDAREGSQA